MVRMLTLHFLPVARYYTLEAIRALGLLYRSLATVPFTALFRVAWLPTLLHISNFGLSLYLVEFMVLPLEVMVPYMSLAVTKDCTRSRPVGYPSGAMVQLVVAMLVLR